MLVVSAEGPNFINRGTWATHIILGVYDNMEDAIACGEGELEVDNKLIVLITNTVTKKVQRIGV